MLTVYPPEGLGSFIASDGKTYNARTARNGWVVLDIPVSEFKKLLTSNQGLAWETLNPEAVLFVAKNPSIAGDAFPGGGRPPKPVVNRAADAPPVMVKMRAPANAAGFSHGGKEHAIGKDGLITVASDVADVLRSHGFALA